VSLRLTLAPKAAAIATTKAMPVPKARKEILEETRALRELGL
jgi:hypothetical protein